MDKNFSGILRKRLLIILSLVLILVLFPSCEKAPSQTSSPAEEGKEVRLFDRFHPDKAEEITLVLEDEKYPIREKEKTDEMIAFLEKVLLLEEIPTPEVCGGMTFHIQNGSEEGYFSTSGKVISFQFDSILHSYRTDQDVGEKLRADFFEPAYPILTERNF